MKLSRRIIAPFVCIALCLGLVCCHPEDVPQVPTKDTEDEQVPLEDTTPIDTSLYSEDDDNHYRMGKDCFLNLPGMVMFKDQDFYFSGSGICYANKTSKVASIYCFDSSCEYIFGECTARFFWRICDAVYQPTDGLIYCLRTGEDTIMSSDGNLYALSMETLEHEMVFQGDGRELRYLQVQNQYVYFGKTTQQGYVNTYRYDVLTGQTEMLGQHTERKIIDLFIRYDQIIVFFENDNELYLTDEALSTFQATGLATSNITAIRHGKCYLAEKTDDAGTVDLYEYDIATQQKRLIASGCENYNTCQTVTAEYVYFISKDKSKLSRCRIEDGQVELLFDFSRLHESAQIRGIKVFDGEMYVSYQAEDRNSPVGKANRYGNLVNKDGKWTFVDFKQGRVLSNFDLSDYQGGLDELAISKNHMCMADVYLPAWMYAGSKQRSR